MIRINEIITKLIKNIGIDKITHFFAGATIALSVTLILCFVGSISNVILYSIIGTNVAVLCGVVKEVVSEYAYEGGMTLFTACIGASAALLMPVMITVAPENWKFLGFLAAASLVFVAVAPHYKGDEAKLHKTAAKVAGACAVAWGMATCWEIVALSLVAYIAVMQVTKSRWAWIAAELTGMAMVYAILFTRLI